MFYTIAFFILAAGAESAPSFELHTTGDKPLVGPIQKMATDGSVTLAGQSPVAGSEVISLRRLSEPVPGWPRTAYMLLHNGDRIVGSPVEINGAFLNYRANAIQRIADEKNEVALRFPLTAISILWLRAPESIDRTRYAQTLGDVRADDRLILRNGDVLAGVVTSLDSRKGEIQIEKDENRRKVDLGQVVAVAFSTKLARIRKPAGAYGHLVLKDGTRLSVLAPSIDEGRLTAQTMYRDKLQIDVSAISAIDIYQGKCVYLSDLKPAKYQYRSYQGEQYNWAADRNLEGQELQIKSSVDVHSFDKGIAVHGECTLVYALDGKYQRFETVVGLDARLGKRGSVELRVLVDGKEQKVGDGKPLTVESGPWRLRIDVKGAKEISLIVLWGEGGNVGDHVDWGDARLIVNP